MLRKLNELMYHPDDLQNSDKICVLKNTLHEITSLSDNSARTFGYHNAESILGKTVFDLKVPSVELAPLYFQQDDQVIKTLKTTYFLNFNIFSDQELKCITIKKSPIVNEDGVAGCETVCDEMDIKQFSSFVKSIYQCVSGGYTGLKKQLSYEIVDSYEQVQLTSRESEVLFLLLYGYSARQIGELLFRSRRTVESHINNIKTKWQVSSMRELIQRAIFTGLNMMIPRSILGKAYLLS